MGKETPPSVTQAGLRLFSHRVHLDGPADAVHRRAKLTPRVVGTKVHSHFKPWCFQELHKPGDGKMALQ